MTSTGPHMTFNGPIANVQFVFGGSPVINNPTNLPQSPQPTSSPYYPSPSAYPPMSPSPTSQTTLPVTGHWTPQVMSSSMQNHHPQASSPRFPTPHHFESNPSAAGLLSPLGSPLESLNGFQAQNLVQYSRQVQTIEQSHRIISPHIHHAPMYIRPHARDFHLRAQAQVETNHYYEGDGHPINPYRLMVAPPCPSPYLQPLSLPGPSASFCPVYPMPEPQIFNWPLDDRDDKDDGSQDESCYASPSQCSLGPSWL